jgi:hypothetical protein
MIGERFNFEDVFFRDLTVCVLDTLEGQIKWLNRFSSGDVFVQVPIYYSLTGDERFLLDSFSDDIVSENRYVELNTDMIPRGHLTLTGFNIKSDEFANPNVWLRMVIENEVEIRKVLTKVRAVPITVNYDLEILLSSEIDTFKCSQSIMNTLWIYKFMYFEHNFMNIDAVMTMPDSNTVQMSRDKNLTSDNKISLKVSFTVETYYPAFRADRINDVGYPRAYGDGQSDLNGYDINSAVRDYVWPPVPPVGPDSSSQGGTNTMNSGLYPDSSGGGIPGININARVPQVEYGVTASFYNTFGTVGGSDFYGSYTNKNFKAIQPKRTRWFDTILRARERASGNYNDPNRGNPGQ